jgi:hypothetical protein
MAEHSTVARSAVRPMRIFGLFNRIEPLISALVLAGYGLVFRRHRGRTRWANLCREPTRRQMGSSSSMLLTSAGVVLTARLRLCRCLSAGAATTPMRVAGLRSR